MVLFYIPEVLGLLVVAVILNHLCQELFVVLSPALHRQLCDLDRIGGGAFCNTYHLKATLVCSLSRNNAPFEAPVPWVQRSISGQLLDVTAQQEDDVPWIVVGHRCGPTSTDSFCTIHQGHRNYRDVPARLNALTFFHMKVQNGVIIWMEDESSNRFQPSVDVSGTSCVFASHQSGAKLPRRHQKIDIVCTNERLGHSHDCGLQRRLTMVVGTVLRDVPGQLCHLGIAT
mmetsp:Transcript_6300/g.15116  ORF Transcript_6300/g.15116 Transcript_6300/m.15116 type:complete len:229 (+) Transcript_6300:1091-1777(+)